MVLTVPEGNHGPTGARGKSGRALAATRQEILDGLKAGDLVVLDDRIHVQGQRVRGWPSGANSQPPQRQTADMVRL